MIPIETYIGDIEITFTCKSPSCTWVFFMKRTPYDKENIRDIVEQHTHWHTVMRRP